MSFWKNKRVCVTGGAGFIGSYLTEFLVEAGAKVTVADNLSRGSKSRIKNVLKQVRLETGDLRSSPDCKKVCRGQEIVLNLAAKVTGIEYNRFHMADMFESNMKLQMKVLHAAAECNVPRFLQVSTACIYPHDAKVPTPESEGEISASEAPRRPRGKKAQP